MIDPSPLPPIPLSDPRREGYDFPFLQAKLRAEEEQERANYSDLRRDGADSPTRRDDWRYINHERKHKEKET